MNKQTGKDDQDNLGLQALKESEERFRNIILWSPDAIIVTDAAGKIEYMNPAAEGVFNRKLESFIGKEFGLTLIDGESTEIDIFRPGKDPGAGDMRVVETEWLNKKAHLITIRDITKHKELEAELRQEKTKAEEYFNIAGVMMLVFDIDGRVSRINDKGCEVLGYNKEDVEGKNWYDSFIPEKNRKEIRSEFHRIANGEEGLLGYYESNIIDKSGEERLIAWNNRILKDSADKAIGMISSGEDITERKRMEKKLIESESEFHSMAESMPQIVWITRPDGWNTYFNQKWIDYTGLTQEASRGSGWNKPFHPDDQKRAWDAWENATQRNGAYSVECRLRRADGVYRWFLIRGESMRDADGKIIKWFGTCTDIEDIKQAEAESQKRLHELEVFYKASIGREERILELKKEIEQLKQEAGERGT